MSIHHEVHDVRIGATIKASTYIRLKEYCKHLRDLKPGRQSYGLVIDDALNQTLPPTKAGKVKPTNGVKRKPNKDGKDRRDT